MEEIREMLSKKPQGSFPCSTSEIQYFDHLGRNCLKKYEEFYFLKVFDIDKKDY